MTISSVRRGRPKGKNGEPKTSAERTRAYREKLKSAGGVSITLALEESEVALMEALKEKWNLPDSAPNAEIIRAMLVVLNGHEFISSGCKIKAKVKITSR